MQRRRLKQEAETPPELKQEPKAQEPKAIADLMLSGGVTAKDGFLSKADPVLIEVLLKEVNEELAFRKGTSTEREELPEPRPLKIKEWDQRNFLNVQRWRHRKLEEFMLDPSLIDKTYANDPVRFICHWCDLYEPRNAGRGLPTKMPFILFKRQEQLVLFFNACVNEEGTGLVEKSRDMGATWGAVAYSIWMWRFVEGSAVGWGSASSPKLDRIGDPGSIFEKMRLCIRGLPDLIKPKGLKDDHLMHTRILNPVNGSSIIGEVGDNIGRGGRTRVYFVDEAAYLEHPESTEASLSENTRVRIDISSVSAPGTVFHKTRQAGVEWVPGKPLEKTRTNVFLMDWSDHPEKTQEWANQRKEFYESRGLGHIYAREIGRSYAAAQEGAVLKLEWIESALDAHKKLKREADFNAERNKKMAGLDVGDTTGDANALTVSEGSLITRLKMWSSRDTSETARDSVFILSRLGILTWQYDCIGLGAGIRAECNRLRDEGDLPGTINLVPWNAGGVVCDPFGLLVKDDPKSQTNREFFANLKSQGWWHVRQLFYNTHRAVSEGLYFPVSQLISIDCDSILSAGADVSLIHKLKDELCQAVLKPTARMKTNVDKAPGSKASPNLADSLIMAKWSAPTVENHTLTTFSAPISIRAS